MPTDFFATPTITSAQSRHAVAARSLSAAKKRRQTGLTRIEGPQALREALAWRPHALTDIYICAEAAQRYPEIADAAMRHAGRVYVHCVCEKVAHHMSPDAQGLLGIGRIDELFSWQDVIGDLDEGAYALVLAHTQDPGNMGTMIRVADAAGASGVAICQGSADPASPKVIRTSVGSVFHLPLGYGMLFDDIADAAAENGVALLGADGSARTGLYDVFRHAVAPGQPHAWVMGNEAHGMTSHQLERCTATVSIPMPGHAESLNVASAATLCLYESARQRLGGSCIGGERS